MRVTCRHCENLKEQDECWCVIDTEKHIRYYECKTKCVNLNVASRLSEEADRIEEGIADISEIAAKLEKELEQMEDKVSDWVERNASRTTHEGILQRFFSWFSTPRGYSKVKLA